jgi:hypothetical protein
MKKAVLVYMSMLVTAAILPAQRQESCNPWQILWIDDNKYYFHNNQYGQGPAGSTAAQSCIWIEDISNWGATWDFHGLHGGIWPNIVIGHWPWGYPRTEHTDLPFQIREDNTTISWWNFSVEATECYNATYEIWIHNSNNTSGNNITCDLMIEPYYSDWHGYAYDTVDFNGVEWYIHVQGNICPGLECGYELPHFQRAEPSGEMGTIILDNFWDYCVEHNMCRETDWIGSINCGMEVFCGKGEITTTAYGCSTVAGVPLEIKAQGQKPVGPRAAQVRLPEFAGSSPVNIYGADGRLVSTLPGERLKFLSSKEPSGRARTPDTGLPRGVYFCKYAAPGPSASRKLLFIE